MFVNKTVGLHTHSKTHTRSNVASPSARTVVVTRDPASPSARTVVCTRNAASPIAETVVLHLGAFEWFQCGRKVWGFLGSLTFGAH